MFHGLSAGRNPKLQTPNFKLILSFLLNFLPACYKSAGMNLPPAVKLLTLPFLFLLGTFLIGAVWIGILSKSLPDVGFLTNPHATFSITVLDWDGNRETFSVGPGNPSWTSLDTIPAHLRNAVLAGEDFSFYSHNGVDWFEVKESVRKNLQLRQFARGASTITQQLAKNLFLSRDKTVTRKIRELILARRLEKTLTKDRILELYLNVVELGEMVYGTGQGSLYHFGKDTTQISLRESAFLAAMLPGPRVFDPEHHMDRVMNRSDHILSVMLKGRMISEDEYVAALAEIPMSGGALSPGDPDPQLPPEGDDELRVPNPGEEPLPAYPFLETEPQPMPVPENGGQPTDRPPFVSDPSGSL